MEASKIIETQPGLNSPVLLGLIGQGPALEPLANILGNENFTKAFPLIQIAGWVPTPGTLPDKSAFQSHGVLAEVPLFKSEKELFAAAANISMALDLSPDAAYVKNIQALASPLCIVASNELILRFCRAADEGRLAIGGGERLRDAHNMFALIVDQFADDILVFDKSGIVIDTNKHAGKSKGLSRADIIGKSFEELASNFFLDSASAEHKILEDSIRSAKPTDETITEVIPDGRIRYLNVMCYPVMEPDSLPSHFLYIRRNVTEHHDLEQRLQQKETMAAIGELSTYMAHEIRNPLFAIGGFANALLRNPALTDTLREQARIIYDESRRLDGILASIINFARPTEQAMGIFEPEAIAKQTVDLLSIGCEGRGIKFIVDIPVKLPKVRGNAENLRQCLVNVVKNSIEAIEDGGGIALRATRNGGFVQIDIEDNGRGIPLEMQEKLFSPFFTTKKAGAGLGLAMSRKFIEEMGGKFHLHSKPGKGTLVSILLPAALDTTVNCDEPPAAGADKANSQTW